MTRFSSTGFVARGVAVGAASGLALAAAVAVSLSLLSSPPSGIEADAFAAYLDRSPTHSDDTKPAQTYALLR